MAAPTNNQTFMQNSMKRNAIMPQTKFTAAGNQIDIELQSVPGWATEIEVLCQIDLAITLATGGTAPSMSSFGPWNIFSKVELSLGGGPFINVSPYFYYLRELATNPGWNPSYAGPDSYAYGSQVYSVPPISATAGSTTDNIWTFPLRIPLQVQHGSTFGMLPLGNPDVTAVLRFTVQPQLYGSDQYLSPLYGGSGVSVAVGVAQPSFVKPTIWYRTTSPAGTGPLPAPQVGYVMNVQEQSFNPASAGSQTPIKFPNPFQYLRLWFIFEDGTGAPNSLGVNSFEVDPLPTYPQWIFPSAQDMAGYWYRVRRMYRQDLPTGVFVADFVSGSDPANPNGTAMINGALFKTLQGQIGTTQTTNVGSPAKIITYAEALSPVGF